jgi:prephenate dehydrogenase
MRKAHMDEDGFKSLAQASVAIIGLGLMGGSLALALKDKCAALIGIDRDPYTLELASRQDIFDRLAGDPAEVLPGSDIIILATPVTTIVNLLEKLPEWHSGEAMILDLGSTKSQICRVMDRLPERFDPLGGHPMCGREISGFTHASIDLYAGAPFALVPLERTSPQARHLGTELATAAGAHPLWLDPETHDRWTAATSHLPYLLASALMLGTPIEASPLFGPGFHSTSRVAATSPTIMLDILQTNTTEVIAALERFQSQLALLEAELRSADWEALRTQLERAAGLRQSISKSSP